MRIISSFRDYYDVGLSYGCDPNLIYKRETEKYSFELNPQEFKKRLPKELNDSILDPLISLYLDIPTESHYRYMGVNDTFSIDPFLIGFCGKLYQGFNNVRNSLHGYKITPYYNLRKIVNDIHNLKIDYKGSFWNRDNTHQVRIADKIDESLTDDNIKKGYKNWKYFAFNKMLSYGNWDNSVNILKDKEFHEIFIELKTTIFAFRMVDDRHKRFTIEINPKLSDFNFQEIKTPFEAYQEISMYIGNRLVIEKVPNENISDETMIKKKGFDDWSFRRQSCDCKKNKQMA